MDRLLALGRDAFLQGRKRRLRDARRGGDEQEESELLVETDRPHQSVEVGGRGHYRRPGSAR